MSHAGVSANVIRPRLLQRLDRARSLPITLVVAPAGYGKSTVVSHWAECQSHPVVWVSLSPSINGTSALYSAISRAMGVGAISPRTTLDAILVDLRERTNDGLSLTLVFDDYHAVENQDVHDAMDGLVTGLPERTRIIIASRSQPPLSLARFRSQGLVDELTEQDLRFTIDEIAAVVDNVAPGRLTPEQIQELVDRTEGWIAGIRLVLLSLQQVDDAQVQSVIDTWTGHRWLDDYIVEEILSSLPAKIREFVMRTAALPWLEPSLCNAVLESEQGAVLVDEVKRRLVFVRPVDGSKYSLTYHGLFAESVQRIAARQLPVAELREIHLRATAWFEQQGHLEVAADLAIAATDWDSAVRCIRPVCRDLMDRDAHHARLYWLEKLPESVILADPHLARWHISALLYTGQHRRALALGEIMAPVWKASDDPAQLGYVASFRAFVALVNGHPDAMLSHVYDALHYYPLECHVERMHAWSAVAGYEFALGNDDVAEEAFLQATRCRHFLPSEQWWWALQIEPDRANQRAVRGQLAAAEAMYQLILEGLPASYRSHEAKIRYRLAAIYLEWDDLERAKAEAEQVERDLASFPTQVWYPEALLVVARVYAALGETEARDDAMVRARALCERGGARKSVDLLETLQASFWLQDGLLSLAQNWARAWQHVDHTYMFTFGDPDPHLVLAQIDLATGMNAAAGTRLQTRIDQATATKRWAQLISFLVTQAIIQLELGDEPRALASFRAALAHAQPGGFVRAFQTPGYDLAPFLARMRSRLTPDEAHYLDRLHVTTHASARERETQDPTSEDEPTSLEVWRQSLTEREREVAALLEEGLTNTEIAERLYISRRTAQKHVINILAKLGVSNRTAAGRLLREHRDPTS
jgi:LuxR family maltose regulon positive regulatory protein